MLCIYVTVFENLSFTHNRRLQVIRLTYIIIQVNIVVNLQRIPSITKVITETNLVNSRVTAKEVQSQRFTCV